jgi:hypothetical protein
MSFRGTQYRMLSRPAEASCEDRCVGERAPERLQRPLSESSAVQMLQRIVPATSLQGCRLSPARPGLHGHLLTPSTETLAFKHEDPPKESKSSIRLTL